MSQSMAATSSFRPVTPARTIQHAPQFSPNRLAAAALPPASYRSGHRNLDVFSPVDQHGSFCFDREIKSGKVNRRVKNKGAWKASWKPAYIVLRPNLLSIYQNEDETDLKASITLSEVTAVALVRKANTQNVFGVFSPSKNYHFQASSAKDVTDWITAIRAETTTEDDEDLDLVPPRFPHKDSEASNAYESTDLSADDQFNLSTSPQAPARMIKGEIPHSQPRASNLQDYSGNEQFTTSHSDFSDAFGSSLPKNSISGRSRLPVLTPIASSGQLPSLSDVPDSSKPASTVLPQAPANESSLDPERVIRQGHLQILKSYKTGVKGWKWIWVVLRARSLSFYKNEQEYAAVKIFNMDTVINAAEIDPISKSKMFCFQIIMEDKSYRFCAPDDEELAKWLGALKSVLIKREAAVKARAKDQPGLLLPESIANLSLR